MAKQDNDKVKFVSGLDLCEAFFCKAVEPALAKHYPSLRYSAALIGSGSEVLGLDNEMSVDHHWGPRVMLFFRLPDSLQIAAEVKQLLSDSLPRTFEGYPTSFTAPAQNQVQLLDWQATGSINHRCEIHSIESFFVDYLGVDANAPLTAVDWLTIPEQKLLSIAAGRVFRDDLNLQAQQNKLSYYPRDVWYYLLACAWTRLEQEEHLMGRAGTTGDDLGSAIIAARLVRDLMRLCFLMEKQYAPYAKWFGTAFGKLASGAALTKHLQAVLRAGSWQERESNLIPAYEYVADKHNRLAITEALPTRARQFFDRPFRVISMGEFSAALSKQIHDPILHGIAKKRPIGSIDQFSDNTDLLCAPELRQILKRLYA